MKIQIYNIFKVLEIYERLHTKFCQLAVEQSFIIDRYFKELKEIENYVFQIGDFKYPDQTYEEWVKLIADEYFHISPCEVLYEDIEWLIKFEMNDEEREIFKLFFVRKKDIYK